MKRQTSTQCPRSSGASYPKTHVRYWEPRVFFPTTNTGNPCPHYASRFRFRRHRLFFNLGTSNREAAAKIARGIYLDLITLGIEAALAKHSPEVSAPAPREATVGEYIQAARDHFGKDPATFGYYAACLRRIAGDIAKTKKSRKRFGRATSDYRKNADAIPLALLTPAAIDRWRIRYVEAAPDPAAKARARTTCNTILRQAKSLFARRRVNLVKENQTLILPDPIPFADVEFWPRESTGYRSRIDPAGLMRSAREDLGETTRVQNKHRRFAGRN